MDVQIVLDEIMRQCAKATYPKPYEDALVLMPQLLKTRPRVGRAYSRWLRERCEYAVSVATDKNAAKRLITVIEEILRLNAASDFDSYMLFMEWRRAPKKQFYRPRRHVLYPLVQDLQDLFDGKLDFLAVSMPPRTGKSTLCIFFLTFVMGNAPTKANVMSGHSDKLCKGFHTEALSIIGDANTYRFAEVFPNAPLKDKSMAEETIHLGQRSRFPSLTCRSIDGTLTGAVEVGAGALLYCDDLVSDREEALNVDRMDKLYAAYLNQLKDRMNDGAKQLFVGTRWVPNDPIGRIEEEYEGNPRYRFTVLPALNEYGKTNFDYLYGLGFSTEYYEDMEASLRNAGEGDSWMAKYMGAPEWIGGLMFSRDQLLFYTELPEGEPDAIICACDTKDKGKDYASMPVAYVYGDKYYIEDAICDNSLPEVVEPKLVRAIVANHVSISRFESNAAGGRVADDVKEACKKLGHSLDMKKVYSTENKETRILADSLWIKEHCYFRQDEPTADYRKFMSMLTHYTTEGKNKNDDAPDSMSMLKRLAASLHSTRVRAFKRPW